MRTAVAMLILPGLLTAVTVSADQVFNDDLIVQGVINTPASVCVGTDCINNEAFNGDTLRLKENNLRIRFVDTTAPNALGQSWNITANGSNNGGRSYFNIELKSLEKDTVLISDGTYPAYDCSQTPPVLIMQTVPAGDPVMQIDPLTNECQTVPDYTVKPIIQLGTTSTNGVALGYDSQLTQDVVSVGKAGLARQLKHVAAGIADTDLVITKTLNDYSPYAEQHAKIAAMNQQLDALNTQLDGIETTLAAAENKPPSAPVLISPADGETGLNPASITLLWERASDPEGDPVTYSATYCKNRDFSGCNPVSVAMTAGGVMVAALCGGTGVLLLGVATPGLRRKQTLINVAAIAIAAAIMTACGGGSSSGNTLSATIRNLDPSTTYYWKVSASDGAKTAESAVRSFTTR